MCAYIYTVTYIYTYVHSCIDVKFVVIDLKETKKRNFKNLICTLIKFINERKKIIT